MSFIKQLSGYWRAETPQDKMLLIIAMASSLVVVIL